MVHAAATIFFINSNAEQSHLAHGFHDRLIKAFFTVICNDPWHQRVAGKLARAIHHHALIISQLLVEHEQVFPVENSLCHYVLLETITGNIVCMRTTYPELDSFTISCDNIVIIFKDTIMKNTFASLLVLVFAIFSSFAQAGNIPFEGGMITYDKGSMNSRDYNGTIEGVIFEFDNGEKAYADRLTLETTPISSPPSFRIERFLVRNFTFEAEGITMAIASLSLRDTIIRGENPDFRMLIETGKIEQAVIQTGRLEMFGFLLAEDTAETFTVDKVVVNGTPVEVAGIGNLPIQSGELIIENMVYIPAYGDAIKG